MTYKDHARKFLFHLFTLLNPIASALVLVAVLQLTGLMSSVSYAAQWVLLETGLQDTDNNPSENEEDFDYQFTIKDLAGVKVSIEKFKGKVIFLNLWATWCGPCRAEMDGIQNLYSNMAKENITFIMLSLDNDRDQEKVVDYLHKNKFTFNAYLPSGYLPQQLRVPQIPTTFVISKEGKIVKKEIGSMRYDTPKFQKFLETLCR